MTLVRYYNLVAGAEVETIEEIPLDSLSALSWLSYTSMAKALIAVDLSEGSSPMSCVRRYGVSRSVVYTVQSRIVS